MNLKRCKRALLTSAFALLTAQALALPEDRLKAINLSSDRAAYENNQGTYTGHVEMNQGSLKIQADELVIVEADRKVQKVIARGTPARFEQRAGKNQDLVSASAAVIEYQIDREEILLLDAAEITHNGSRISGERIVYSGRKQTVTAQGSDDQKESTRVKMTLQPQSTEARTGNAPADQPAEPVPMPTSESANDASPESE